MPQILLKDVDERTVNTLKKRAETSGRTLQMEIKHILQQATAADYEKALKEVKAIRKSLAGKKITSPVELIREDRER